MLEFLDDCTPVYVWWVCWWVVCGCVGGWCVCVLVVVRCGVYLVISLHFANHYITFRH